MIRRQLYLRALCTRMQNDQSDVRLYVTWTNNSDTIACMYVVLLTLSFFKVPSIHVLFVDLR